MRCPECEGESTSRNSEGQLVCDDCGTVINHGVEMTEVRLCLPPRACLAHGQFAAHVASRRLSATDSEWAPHASRMKTSCMAARSTWRTWGSKRRPARSTRVRHVLCAVQCKPPYAFPDPDYSPRARSICQIYDRTGPRLAATAARLEARKALPWVSSQECLLEGNVVEVAWLLGQGLRGLRKGAVGRSRGLVGLELGCLRVR